MKLFKVQVLNFYYTKHKSEAYFASELNQNSFLEQI